MNPIGKGIMVATAVAALVMGGDLVAQAQTKAGDAVKCTGVNECKGKGGCKSAQNDCKGKNACKGKGFVETKDAKECTTKGGMVKKS
jgi:hypothetical protein